MLSVIIIAKNEALHIRACLESVRWADELIVLDSGSTDDTLAIAHEFTDHVYSTDWQGYGIQKQRALRHATGDWVLNLDADERVDAHLQLELVHAMKSKDLDAYRVPIQMYFDGKPLRFSSSPQRHIRLFKREGAAYSADIVHEKIVLPVSHRVGQLKTPLQHHSFRDISHVLYKINRYSSYSARIRIDSHKKMNFTKMLVSTFWMFFRCYFLQFGFLDGKVGFLFSVFNAQGSFYRGLKQLYPDVLLSDLP
jgi:glycosyltransferase involved in cell wall biosynthesis